MVPSPVGESSSWPWDGPTLWLSGYEGRAATDRFGYACNRLSTASLLIPGAEPRGAWATV